MDFPGSPAVRARFKSNILNAFVVVINKQIVIAGMIRGKIIFLTICPRVTPSISAASFISSEIFWIAAM